MRNNKPESARRSPILRVCVFAAFGAVLFFVAVHGLNLGDFNFNLSAAVSSIAATFPLMLAAILIAGWRLSVLAGGEVRIHDGMAVNAIAQLVVLIVPSRLSEAAKPIGLNLLSGVPLARGVAVLAIERVLDAAFLAVMAFLAVAIVSGPYRQSLQSSGLVLVMISAAGVIGIALLIARPRLLHRLTGSIPVPWFRRQADHVTDAFSRLSNLHATSLALSLTASAWLVSYLIFVVFFAVLGFNELSYSQILVVFVASTLGLVVSVTPGGLGTFEGAIAVSLSAFGVPVGTAVVLAILLRLCLVVPVVAASGWYLSTGGLSLSRMLERLRNWRTAK